MIVEDGFERMVELVRPVIAEWTEEVVPGRVELLPHNRYSPRYAWMFSFEKRLKHRIEDTLGRPLGPLERELFGADGVFSEGLSNAFVHGHGRDSDRPIRVGCVIGRAGLVLAIQDRGSGFSVAEHLERAQRGSPSFHFAGNGLRSFIASRHVHVSLTHGGRRLNLLVPLAGA